MFTYSQWLSDLLKAAGHKYLKRVPYMSGGKMRYRYIYKVAHSAGGRLLLDPEHMTVGAAFQVHAESGSEIHAHIVSTSGDKVTYKLDDGPDKGQDLHNDTRGACGKAQQDAPRGRGDRHGARQASPSARRSQGARRERQADR